MSSDTTARLRPLLAAVVPIAALVVAVGLSPQGLVCQDCKYEGIYMERKEDGVYLCVEKLDCGHITAENFCRLLGR